MHYRRSKVAGGTYFFTVNIADRSSRMLVDRVDDLRASIRLVKQRHPFDITAWVVLPDHLHAIWILPDSDSDYSTRWTLIKAGFSRRIESGEQVRPSRRAKRERGIWQRRCWEHQIRDDEDMRGHVDYVHFNPVKHGHVLRASDWPYSSLHRYIRAGDLPIDWAASPDEHVMRAGERAGHRCAQPNLQNHQIFELNSRISRLRIRSLSE